MSAVVEENLYEQDFYAWANKQAALLRAGKLEQVDLEHVAEEIESMGKSEKRALASRIEVLLMHLLKWQFQPNLQSRSWGDSIEEQRERIVDLLEDNPSLKSQIDESFKKSYFYAVKGAVRETGLSKELFPTECPWVFEQIIANDFWPQ
ncbi:MAG: DUF29 domain-containing protein [Pseudomonadota bacterium]